MKYRKVVLNILNTLMKIPRKIFLVGLKNPYYDEWLIIYYRLLYYSSFGSDIIAGNQYWSYWIFFLKRSKNEPPAKIS